MLQPKMLQLRRGAAKEINNEFFKNIKNIVNPDVEEEINSGDPYILCDLLEKTKGGPNGIYFKKIENAIIETNDIVQIYEFLFLAVDMNIQGFDRERFEKIIRESGNSKLMCYCMGFVPGTNIEEMIKALKDTKNAKYMEMIIENEEYEEILGEVKQIDPNYEECVEEAKEFDYFPESLKSFITFKDNIEELKNEVIATKNPHLITELANYIEYLNKYKNQSYSIESLTTAQEEMQDPMQAYEYLASVDVNDKGNLIQAVINSGRVKFMYYVHEYVSGVSEEEKDLLKKEIQKRDSDGKYKKMIEDIIEQEERGDN